MNALDDHTDLPSNRNNVRLRGLKLPWSSAGTYAVLRCNSTGGCCNGTLVFRKPKQVEQMWVLYARDNCLAKSRRRQESSRSG